MKFKFTFLFIITTFLSYSQVDKIKIKKEEKPYTEFKNDTCGFKVYIDKDVYAQNLILHSLDINDDAEKKIWLNDSYRSIVMTYLEKYIEVGPTNIQNMFSVACKVNGYKLKKVVVKKHVTKNPDFQNRVDIILTYLK